MEMTRNRKKENSVSNREKKFERRKGKRKGKIK
jgi:hypothetical protein